MTKATIESTSWWCLIPHWYLSWLVSIIFVETTHGTRTHMIASPMEAIWRWMNGKQIAKQRPLNSSIPQAALNSVHVNNQQDSSNLHRTLPFVIQKGLDLLGFRKFVLSCKYKWSYSLDRRFIRVFFWRYSDGLAISSCLGLKTSKLHKEWRSGITWKI